MPFELPLRKGHLSSFEMKITLLSNTHMRNGSLPNPTPLFACMYVALIAQWVDLKDIDFNTEMEDLYVIGLFP